MLRAGGTNGEARLLLPGRREVGRYEEVVRTLTAHGLDLGVQRIGLGRINPFRQRLPGGAPAGAPAHLRQALGDLGVTFIKLGQVLSTRPDLLPPEYLTEVSQLQESVPPADPVAIRAVIEEEFGRPVTEIFTSFDDDPLASASIGQVHAAQLPGGIDVVVKVQKPGVQEQIATDLAVLRRLAGQAERRSQLARQYRAALLVDELHWTLEAELDYVREGRNSDRFGEQFADEPKVRTPRIFWNATTRRVLTMERVSGIHIDRPEELERAGVDRSALAARFSRMVMVSVLRHGFFHADPHPGNYLVQRDGTIVILDFGMAGTVDAQSRAALIELFVHVVSDDPDGVLDALERVGIRPPPDERSSMRREVAHVIDAYYGRELRDLSVAELLQSFSDIARRHAVLFPPELALMAKTVAMSESIARGLDPQFNPAEEAERLAPELLNERLHPRELAERAVDTLGDAASLAIELPGQLRRVIRQVEHGDFEVRLRRDEIDLALDGFSTIINRLAASIIGAAMVIAIALLLQIYQPPGWQVLAALGLFGGPVVVALLWGWAFLSTRRRG